MIIITMMMIIVMIIDFKNLLTVNICLLLFKFLLEM